MSSSLWELGEINKSLEDRMRSAARKEFYQNNPDRTPPWRRKFHGPVRAATVGGASVNLLPSKADQKAFRRSQKYKAPGAGARGAFGSPFAAGPSRAERRATKRADKAARRAQVGAANIAPKQPYPGSEGPGKRRTPGRGFRRGKGTGTLSMGAAAEAPTPSPSPKPVAAGNVPVDHGLGPLKSPGKIRGVLGGTYGRRALIAGGVLVPTAIAGGVLASRKKKVEKRSGVAKSELAYLGDISKSAMRPFEVSKKTEVIRVLGGGTTVRRTRGKVASALFGPKEKTRAVTSAGTRVKHGQVDQALLGVRSGTPVRPQVQAQRNWMTGH